MILVYFTSIALIYVILTYLRLNFFEIKFFQTNKDEFNQKTFKFEDKSQTGSELFLIVYSFCIYVFRSEVILENNHYSVFLLTVVLLTLILKSMRLHLFNYLILLTYIFSNILLICTKNIIQAYLVIEIIAYLNLLLLTTNLYSKSCSKKNDYLISLLTYFLTNFLSSVVLYLSIFQLT